MEIQAPGPDWPLRCGFACYEARLIVECDGPTHEADEARRRDARRDAWFHAEGFSVLRLLNDLVLGAPDLAVQKIEGALQRGLKLQR